MVCQRRDVETKRHDLTEACVFDFFPSRDVTERVNFNFFLQNFQKSKKTP